MNNWKYNLDTDSWIKADKVIPVSALEKYIKENKVTNLDLNKIQIILDEISKNI